MSDNNNFFNLPNLPKKEDIEKLRENGLKVVQDFTDALTAKKEAVQEQPKPEQTPEPVAGETIIPMDDGEMFDAFDKYLEKKK